MNNLSRITVFLLLLAFVSCQELGVELRIENVSNFHFDDVSVNNVSFGPLGANQVSEYLPFENIYSSEFIQVNMDGQVLKLVPDSFNKEEYFNTGRYKFEVDIIHRKWLLVEFTEE